jgi:hypothetical protein
VHRPSDDHRRSTELAAWQLVLPPLGRFTHVTGAELHGWPTLPVPARTPVFVGIARDESRPQRAGLHVARHETPADPTEIHGLRVDPPPEVLLECARHLSLLDLVVLVDAALHSGSTKLPELAVVAARRRRGAPLLRRAIGLADGRSESVWETLLRTVHVACDVEVVPQHPLLDHSGTEIARADLWLAGTNALHEYDGEHHLSRPRQRKDLARSRRIGNVEWIRRGYTSVEVLHQAVGILRDADLSLGREHRPERIRAWHALLADSVFTPSGQTRLLRRLGLSPTGEERQVRSA